MKFILHDYQKVASEQVVTSLRSAAAQYDSAARSHSAVSLCAPTAAGKTVIATDVVERTLFGDESTPANPNAIFLWVTDNPSLNEQTRRAMLGSSDRLTPAHLVTIDLMFDMKQLAPGKVYFLNAQKLGRSATYVQGGTDRRSYSLWDTLSNTIAASGSNFVVIIDEAHRGTGKTDSARPTILTRIIAGLEGENLPAPIVWGISATPKRFQKAMDAATRPSRLITQINVPVEDVRASGLIKDRINLSYPTETQPSAITMVTLAAQKRLLSEQRWAQDSEQSGDPLIVPALVVQLPAKITNEEWKEIVNALKAVDSSLTGSALAHSLDSHSSVIDVAPTAIRYVAPEDIQDDTEIKVVFFKEALTTGWNCPRAEVKISLRRALDETYITQLVGRMIRTPRARRITTDEALNSVDLILPYYDRTTVESIIAALTSGEDAVPIEVVTNGIDCGINPNVSKTALQVLAGVPTYTNPSRIHSSEIARLHRLAHQLEVDKIVENATQQANRYLISTLDRELSAVQASGEMGRLVHDLSTIEIEERATGITSESNSTSLTSLNTTIADVNRAFGNARRVFADGLAQIYWNALCDRPDEDGDLTHPDDAKVTVAALALRPATAEAAEVAAASKVRDWFQEFSRNIQSVPVDSREKYEQIRAQSHKSEQTTMLLASSIQAKTGSDSLNLTKHIYSGSDGNFPIVVTGWEKEVLEHEIAQSTTIAWYRNPTGGNRSVRIAYEDSGITRMMYPDFVFIHDTPEGLKPSIVDPHNYSLADTGPKWRALAKYAEKHADAFHRIDVVIRDTDGRLLRLDLKSSVCRDALNAAENSREAILQVFLDHGGLY